MKEGPTKEVTVKYNCNGCTYLESGIVYECSEPTVVARQKRRQAGAFKWAYLGVHAEAHPFCPYVGTNEKTNPKT